MSERIVINNATIVTMNDARDVLFDAALVVEADRITEVVTGPVDTAGARVIDASGKIVMPGLVDFHYHTALGKGWSDHLPLWEYLQTCWYPMIRALDPESGSASRQVLRVEEMRLEPALLDPGHFASGAARAGFVAPRRGSWASTSTR